MINLDVEKVELNWVSCIDILVREEVLPPQQQSFVDINGLLSKSLGVIQPVHCNNNPHKHTTNEETLIHAHQQTTNFSTFLCICLQTSWRYRKCTIITIIITIHRKLNSQITKEHTQVKPR